MLNIWYDLFRSFMFLIENVQPLIEADSLLSYNLLFVCPVNHLPMLCDVVPLEIFIDAFVQSIKPTYDEV